MDRCKYCGVAIYWDKTILSTSGQLIPMEVATNQKHDYVLKPNHPEHKRYADGDNDNAEITRMQDNIAQQAVTRKVLKPSQDTDLALQEKVKQVNDMVASLDNEYQEYKRKTDRRLTELEERIKKIEEGN